jgi:hypothetical protein
VGKFEIRVRPDKIISVRYPLSFEERDLEDYLAERRVVTRQLHSGGLDESRCLLDMRDAQGLSAVQRRRVLDWSFEMKKEFPHVRLARTAILQNSALVRGAIQAFNWFTPPWLETRGFVVPAEAETWLARPNPRSASAVEPAPPR